MTAVDTATGFLIPGSDVELHVEYDDAGTLTRLAAGATVHLERTDQTFRLGDGLAELTELQLPRGLLRRVTAHGETWTERYSWDAGGRPTQIDGVHVERDARGRVTAAGEWRYEYGEHGLTTVHTPAGERRIARAPDGRPTRVREPGGASEPVPTQRDEDPPGWARDALGRLWTASEGGAIVATYLWSGMRCIGRVDGPPDAPLAAAFMLDPSGTPVRVVTRDGVIRIPRDAYGEGLLRHPGVPGLFGGPVHRGRVRLPLRAVDPRLGAYDAPDPLDGRAADPRRADGFKGLLPVDRGHAYAVCRDDPIGRADPTGGISALAIPVVLSSMTWSSQYNILNIHFLQLLVNLFASLFTTDRDGKWNMRRWASMEAIASEYGGGFGFRFDPAGLMPIIEATGGRAFTLGHVFWATADDEAWDGLKVIRLFAPAAPWEPTNYGTLLRAEPERAKRFTLRSPGGLPNEQWTRAGGTAVPVFPGSRLPRFPSGGLHFNERTALEPGNVGAQTGRMTELASDGTVATGLAVARTRLLLPETGLELEAGAGLLLTAGTDRELHEVAGAVERDDKTAVRLTREVHLVVAPDDKLKVRGATLDATSEPLPAGATPDRLDARAPASGVRYVKGDVLKLVLPAAPPAGAPDPLVRDVDRLEVKLTFDEPAPTEPRQPWELFLGQPTGAALPVTKQAEDELEFPDGQEVPGRGEAIAISSGATTVGFVIFDDPAERRRRLDRPLPVSLTDPLTWRPVSRGRKLGLASDPPAGTALSYVPEASGQAPAADALVVIEDRTVRRVATLVADELVLGTALAGVAAGTAVTTTKVMLGDPDIEGAEREPLLAMTFAPLANRAHHTLLLHQLMAPALAPGPFEALHEAPRAGDVATVALPPAGGVLPGGELGTFAPNPGTLVVLAPDSGGPLAAVIKAVRVKLTLDRRLQFPDAKAAAPFKTGLDLIALELTGPAYAADRLAGDRVLLRPEVRVGAAPTRVEFPRPAVGDLVELNWTGAPATRLYRVIGVAGCAVTLDPGGGALPAATPALTVQRLDVVNPQTGTWRMAREGELLALRADESDVRADVWMPASLPTGVYVAVSDGTLALPARVKARSELQVEWLPAGVPAAATKVSISFPVLGTLNAVPVADANQEGAEVVLEAVAAGGITAGPNLVLAVDYTQDVSHAAGAFDPGSVLVPVDPTVELSRHQALVDHEMTHTEQAAAWGPLLLSPLPYRGLEDFFEAIGHEWPDALHRVGRLYSIGGVMNFLASTIISGSAWVLFKTVAFFTRLFTGQPLSWDWFGHADWLTFHPATIPDASQPKRIEIAAGEDLELNVGALVEVTAGETFRRASVLAVNGRIVDLDDPAPAGADLKVALVADGDETSLVEHAVMRHAGFGELETAFDVYFDPWSTLADRGGFDPGSFEDILTRVARDHFGASSWTLFPFAYFLFDNGIKNARGDGHLSHMEQSASETSGELYAALAKLHGDVKVVGDVGRYFHFIEARHGTALLQGMADAPVPPVIDLIRVMPSARENLALPAGGVPNEQIDSAPDAALPATEVPDAFMRKALPLAIDPTLPAPRSFPPSALGLVPASPRLERCYGAYVAFTKPQSTGHHRVTAPDGFAGAGDAAEAQREGKQTLFYDLEVADVDVQLAGAPVTEAGTVPLLRGQKVTLVVTPAEERRYGTTLLQPANGPLLRGDGSLTITAQGVNGKEPVQVDRVYSYADGKFDHPALETHGVHLPADVRIPVRRFDVEVVDTVPPRANPDPKGDALTEASHPGDAVYVIVPSAVKRPLTVDSVTYVAAPPAPVTDPKPSISVADPSAAAAPLVGPGNIFRVTFGVADPPEAPLVVNLSCRVAVADGDAPVTARVALSPHFTLDGPATVARGGALELTCSDGVQAGPVTVSPAGQITPETDGSKVTLAVAAGAAAGKRTVIVQEGSNPAGRARRTFTVT